MTKYKKLQEQINAHYVQSVAVFPNKVRDQDSDDLLAWKVGRKPVKASDQITNLKLKNHHAVHTRTARHTNNM